MVHRRWEVESKSALLCYHPRNQCSHIRAIISLGGHWRGAGTSHLEFPSSSSSPNGAGPGAGAWRGSTLPGTSDSVPNVSTKGSSWGVPLLLSFPIPTSSSEISIARQRWILRMKPPVSTELSWHYCQFVHSTLIYWAPTVHEKQIASKTHQNGNTLQPGNSLCYFTLKNVLFMLAQRVFFAVFCLFVFIFATDENDLHIC